jgi:hypothetical protein
MLAQSAVTLNANAVTQPAPSDISRTAGQQRPPRGGLFLARLRRGKFGAFFVYGSEQFGSGERRIKRLLTAVFQVVGLINRRIGK